MVMDLRTLKDLIIVPTHAVYIGKQIEDVGKDACWLKGFPGEGIFYAEHADAGINIAEREKDALLLFSGGQTVRNIFISEALSYLMLEEQQNWLHKREVKERTELEEFARDSFENLDFGIKGFMQITGNKPRNIFVSGWGFKEERYKMHAKAIGCENMTYISVNEPSRLQINSYTSGNLTPYRLAIKGERKAIELFRNIPLGNAGELLDKKLKRDPHYRGNPYK